MPRKIKRTRSRKSTRRRGKSRKLKKFGRRKAKIPLFLAKQHQMVHLKYEETTSTYIIGSGSLYGSVQYTVNNAYDLNPSAGGGTINGWSFYSGMYYKYRVMGVKANITIHNGEAFPIYMGCYWYTANAVRITGWANLRGSKGLPYSRQKLIAPAGEGGAVGSLSVYCPMKCLLGEPGQYKVDPNYVGNTSASSPGGPTTLFYMDVYVLTGDGITSLTTASKVMKVEFDIYIDFFNRRDVLN